MRTSIVFKLFAAVAIVFCLFTSIITIAQSFLLERFYVMKKVDSIKGEMDKFITFYESGSWDMEVLDKILLEFYERNNASLSVLSRRDEKWYYNDGPLDYDNKFEMVIRTDNNTEVVIPLMNMLYSGDQKEITALKLQEGSSVVVRGFGNRKAFVPLYIRSGNETWTANRETLLHIPMQSGGKLNWDDYADIRQHEIEGEVVKVTIPSNDNLLLSSKKAMLYRGVSQWIDNMEGQSVSSEISIYEYTDSVTGVQNKMFVKPISEDGEVKDVIFAMTSLQPVNEAVEVVKSFYWYAFFLSLLLIIFISFYFSKIITHPLIKMNRVTRKMATLDFSEKIRTNSNDEIGSLSSSINTLSDNLRETIDELQVANKELQKDIEKERKLENTRREFISGVSHELKTPLSVIKSYTEGIKDNISQERTAYYTEVILEEIEKMDTLVVDMLELAKLESGTYDVDTEGFSIVGLLDDVYHKLLFVLQDKNMDIEFVADDDYEVMADRRRMEQVMTNFITNAVRYGDEDSDIIIRLVKEEGVVRIEIENEGPHIPEEVMGKLWDRFYRVDDSRNRHKGGTGLGLSIVRNILDLHNVAFGVENKENGVRFYFYLPIHKEKE